MQGLTLALALTGASALVAPAAPRAATALKAEAAEVSNTDEVFDYSSIAGGESGLGGRYDFDPMNFAGRYPGMVPWFREAELKHGRMCMLASIGMVVPAIVRVPGEQFQGTYTGWEAHDRLVASGSLGQILLFVGLAETLGGIPAVVATMKGERAPGDFEFGATFKPTDEKELKRKQLAELKNGRLAMLAIMGVAFNHVIPGALPGCMYN